MIKEKVSRYNIIAKRANGTGYVILNGYTGSIDYISENIAKIILKNNIDSLPENKINYLHSRGYLCNESLNEVETIKDISSLMHEKLSKKYNIGIIPSMSCNFACPYCFEKTLQSSNYVLTPEIIDEIFIAIDNLANINKEIILFGGEPLQTENYGLVKLIVEKGFKRGFRFYGSSNGYCLDDFEDLLGPDKIHRIQMTLDGTEEIHNKTRFLKNGQPSFSKIVNNINLCIRKNIDVIIRTNLSNDNIINIPNLIDFYQKEGWLNNDNFIFLFRPVQGCNSNQILNEIHLFEEFKNLGFDEDFIVRHLYFFVFQRLIKLINLKKLILFQSEACASNKNHFLIAPNKKLYLCEELVGTNDFCGELVNGTFIFNKQYYEWNNRYVSNMNSCIKCPYALFCSGGCTIRCIRTKKSIFDGYCNDFPSIFKKCLSQIENNNIPSCI